MDKLNCMNQSAREYFAKKWLAIFPFSIVAIVLMGVYYVIGSVYMLFDYVFLELDAIINGKIDSVPEKVLVVRNLLAFFLVFVFYLVRVMLGLVLAIIYFLAIIFAIVGSAFTFRKNPFAFHALVNPDEKQ